MDRPRIGIIVGTTRETRFGMAPAQWLERVASERTDLSAEIVDLRDFPMPFFDEPASNLHTPSRDPAARRWQATIDALDGYVFVVAEYNHSISGVLKNALDYASHEWHRKPAACLGYGSLGAARAVEHLRGIAVELQMAPLRHAVHIIGSDYRQLKRGEASFDQIDRLRDSADAMLDQLAWWASALRTAREQPREAETAA